MLPTVGANSAIASRGPLASRSSRSKTLPAKNRPPWPVVLFLVGLVVPWIIPLGPLNLSVYRIVLLLTLLPCLWMLASGRAGRVRAPDIGLLMYCGWSALSLVKIHGAGLAVEPAGILLIETLGAYLLARCYIRDAADFENVIIFMAKIISLLFPFAVYEWLTGNKPILSAFSTVFPTVEVTMMQPRLGFWRVQGPFDHSIVFGVFCGSIFALSRLCLRADGNTSSGGFRMTLTACATIMSMSSAPIAGLAMQGVLILWNWLLKRYRSRWKLLWALVFAAYLVVEFGSNQTPIKFYISHFTFDGATGWYRLSIWEYGSASVLNHPLFGIGLADWARPKWMASDSIDNFWLIIAMRNGVPALVLMFGSYLWIVFSVAFREINDEKLQNYRVAYLICMAVYFFVGTTVHFYVAPYAWFMFLLGSGVWLLDVKRGDVGAVRYLGRSSRNVTPVRLIEPGEGGEPRRRGTSRGRPATDVSVPAGRRNGK